MNTKNIFHTLSMASILFLMACGQSNQTQQQTAAEHTQGQHGNTGAAGTQSQVMPTSPEPALTIPEFNFYRLNNGMRFERSDLSYKGNIVMVFFDPTCVQCQQEAKDMSDHYDRIEGASIYFISMNDPALIHAFLPTYASALAERDNVIALYDRDQHFINRVHLPSQYPSTYVYGSDGKLKTYWNGYKDIEEILVAINN